MNTDTTKSISIFSYFSGWMSTLVLLFVLGFMNKAESRSDEAMLSNIQAYLEQNSDFNGVVLIAKNGQVIIEYEHGYANYAHKTPNKIGTKFQTASMAKMFTAVAIMQLVESGQLKVDDVVGKFLPDYPNEIVKNKVTIHQLLTHQSGLSDYFNPKYDNHSKSSINKLSDFLQFFEYEPLNFIPGQSSQYSNSGYLLLGLIIEKITGENYYDHIEKTIFKPAGMKNTGWRSDEVVEGLAGTYEYSLINRSLVETNLGGAIGSSAGGAYSTAHDFLAFAQATSSYQIISKDILDLMTIDHNGRGYGYGLSLYKAQKETSFGHSGGAHGVAANMDIFRQSGYVAVVLSNRSAMDGWYEVRSFIRREIGGKTAHTDRFFNTQKVLTAFKNKGLKAARKQLEIAENKVSIRYMLHESDQYRKREEYNQALEILRMTVQINPDDETIHAAMGDVFHKLGKNHEAVKSYEKSLKLYPNDEILIEKLKRIKVITDEK